MASLLPIYGQATDPKSELITQLLEAKEQQAFEAAVKKAKAAGIHNQALLEAEFLFLVDQRDYAGIAALAPRLEAQLIVFRQEDSIIFSVPEEYQSIIKYSHALAALYAGDAKAFENNLKEAFWLSPRQATSYAPHIEQIRRQRAMAKLKIDFGQEYVLQSNGTKSSLQKLKGDAEYVLLHFWSPWSNECVAFVPDFLAMETELRKRNIPVISVLIEPGDDALRAARNFGKEFPADHGGAWIVDNFESSLSAKLRVQDLPTMVLVSSAGAVSFNGHPSEPSLWDALRKAAPGIERPRLQPNN